MPRRAPFTMALVALAIMASACSATASGESAEPDSTAPQAPSSSAAASMPAASAEVPGAPAAGTQLDACEIVTPEDITAAFELEGIVDEGELTEDPTSLSPGHTTCRYTGDWGGLVVSLTPEDGANLFDAARGSYADASDREVAGADGAFWSEDQHRGFFWKGAVGLMLQITHLTAGGDFGEATVAVGQAAMDRVD
jgi:hypothetical protein